ncbi:monosaccharide ABC transporter substrate-binding protein (CUT2 family) [Streptomyces sp. SLBN-118]|uniref:sugar ABC transporter substrate-binding protein n=1 Tax=Streptomyces sp. SLBN-118 TaxID=2768454 RepID=UPI0011685901|nr:substrate-binding domain-containing protein [Streptomyces sp. SLBN-118]TQK42773.1 monosaccharide ABC transporter substrate-binding protein (CUT2 family) [Streptomyces sp. SLBN-118]
MNALLRRSAVVVAASTMSVSLAACGGDEGSGVRISDDITVGLLLPENEAARYEKFDLPVIKEKIGQLTNDKGKVVYVNAKQDATLQSRQVETMIADKVDVLIVDAVDSKAIAGSIKKADEAGIPVVAFDRLAEGPIDAYTSFDNEEVGHVQGKALLTALGSRAKDGQIVMMNGAVTDPNAAMFKKGAHTELDGKVNIGEEYDTKDWKPENATANMVAAIESIGNDKIIGVYSANDGMAGGIITALKSAGIFPVPPVTGQDAELAAVQRIVAGEQYASVYKPYAPEAAAAAEMAILLARGMELGMAQTDVDSPTTKSIPSVLVPVISLTKENIQETVIKDGVYTAAEICTPKYKAACGELGLK